MAFTKETAKSAGQKGGKAFVKKYGKKIMKLLSSKGHKARWKKS